jgi:hypothetical protein
MLAAEFDSLLMTRLDKAKATLASKASEYATAGDRLHNFKRAAQLRSADPAETLLGMMVKHWVSVEDLVQRHIGRATPAPPGMVDEKIGDAINYLILLEALLKDQPQK